MKHKYKVFGLFVHSEIDLPELVPVNSIKSEAEIIFHAVPKHLPIISGSGPIFQAAPNDFLFRLDSIGAFRVMNGSTIHIDLEPNANRDTVRLFLLGSVFGALLFQRNMLPIHGSAIKLHDRSTIISGASAAGKSSLAASFVNRGYELLSDDITALSYLNGEIKIHSGIPHIKIWKDVVLHMAIKGNLAKVRPELEKYRMPVSRILSTTAIRPNYFIQLEPVLSQEFKIIKVSGSEKFNILMNNIYRSKYIIPLGISEQIFSFVVSLAKSISVYRVQRPHSPILLVELTDLIQKEIFDIEG